MANKLDTLTVNLSSAPYQRAFTTSTSPVVLFTVLDHYLRRDQSKVLGAILGVRSPDGTEVEIRNAFPLIYTTENDDIVLDKDHYRTMYELHQRVNPDEIIVGWYTAGADLTPACTPVHSFFAEDVAPFQPIHITIDTDALLKTSDMGLRAYASAPVGFSTKPGDCMFLSVPCEVKYLDAERSGLDMLASAKSKETRTASLISDMDHLEIAITKLQEMLERISKYVDSVVDGSVPPNNAIGRYIMDTVSVVPKVDSTAFEKMFNSHLQDLLMVVYLANMTRTQLSVAERLQLLVAN
ncbi:maintenance of mitochondrial structure and function-domain-containing protein [Gilbertella persicaria]|uniref:maintenance of mitochondrial structure and function-domain-containing protein n=1 Tax=Gilbertella persicaria TaxID=101096 RepID=UPI00221E6A2B|nr:maintenance of mitochondrial structure and function-domain-containing protein [Gilbertella persicaria]KAI8070582.1 maintenance of mitochondrial structure and function-domain-containing protein [Gilbertella persicaria]